MGGFYCFVLTKICSYYFKQIVAWGDMRFTSVWHAFNTNVSDDSFSNHTCLLVTPKLLNHTVSLKDSPLHHLIHEVFWEKFTHFPEDRRCKFDLYKTFRRRPGHLPNVLCKFNLCLVTRVFLNNTPKRWYTSDTHENYPIFIAHPLCIYVQNSSTPLTMDVQFQTNSFLQIITHQLYEHIIQRWLLYIIGSFLQVGLRFQYQISFGFFSLSWSLTICFFVALYSCVCSCPKILRNIFYLLLFIIIHIFSTHIAINLFYLHNLKKEQTMEQHPHPPRHIQIDHVLYCSI